MSSLRYLPPSRRLCFYLCLSVCLFVSLSVNRITQKLLILFFMKFYGMFGHNPHVNQLDFDWPGSKIKVTIDIKGQTRFSFANNSILNVIESRHKLQCSLFHSLHMPTYGYGHGFNDRNQRSNGPGHNEIKYNSLKCNLGLFYTVW